jgi:UDP-N-acetylmuramate: L-alanyl-gamma-D-glutamyl-meso-diaminopimelate ligase
VTFGIGGEVDWGAGGVLPRDGGSTFRLLRKGQDAGEVYLAVPGLHNVRNALAALAAASEAGVPLEALSQALPGFSGVKRRLELRGVSRGIQVYDDFAHHPTAVRETLLALRAGAETGRLVAVFEPRSYTSRTRVFQEAFAEAFSLADLVVIARAFRPEKVPEGERLSEEALVSALVERGTLALFLPGVEEIVPALARELRSGDKVAILSNGGFGGIHARLLAAL